MQNRSSQVQTEIILLCLFISLPTTTYLPYAAPSRPLPMNLPPTSPNTSISLYHFNHRKQLEGQPGLGSDRDHSRSTGGAKIAPVQRRCMTQQPVTTLCGDGMTFFISSALLFPHSFCSRTWLVITLRQDIPSCRIQMRHAICLVQVIVGRYLRYQE